MAVKKKNPFLKVWDLLISPASFVLVSCLWCLDLGIGSIIAYKRDPKFWVKMDSVPFTVWMDRIAPGELPYSAWVYILVGLTWVMVISLALCTVHWFFRRRATKRGPAELLVHLGFMLVFIGFVLGSGWGEKVQNIQITKGEIVDIESMGVKLKLDDVKRVLDEAGNALDTVSYVSLLDEKGELIVEGEAKLNHPLIDGPTVVYPNGGGEAIIGAHFSVQGMGARSVSKPTPLTLPNGNTISFRGGLEEGRRYKNWMGPGAYLVLSAPDGRDLAGAFIGSVGVFNTARLGNMQLTWIGPVVSVQAVFNVHRDPGVQFVLWGAIILMLGTAWAFFGFLRRTQ